MLPTNKWSTFSSWPEPLEQRPEACRIIPLWIRLSFVGNRFRSNRNARNETSTTLFYYKHCHTKSIYQFIPHMKADDRLLGWSTLCLDRDSSPACLPHRPKENVRQIGLIFPICSSSQANNFRHHFHISSSSPNLMYASQPPSQTGSMINHTTV